MHSVHDGYFSNPNLFPIIVVPLDRLRNQIPSDENPAPGLSPRVVAKSKPDARSASSSGPATTTTIVKRTIKNDGTIVPTITTYTIQPLQMDASSDGEVTEHHHQDGHGQQQHVGDGSGTGVDAGVTVEMMQEDEEILDDEEEEDSVEHVVESDMLADSEDGGVEDMIELKFIDAQQQQQQQAQHQHHQQQQETTHRVQSVQMHENGTASLQLVGTTDRTEFASKYNIAKLIDHVP